MTDFIFLRKLNALALQYVEGNMNHIFQRSNYSFIRFRFTSGLFAIISAGAQEFHKHRLALRNSQVPGIVKRLRSLSENLYGR